MSVLLTMLSVYYSRDQQRTAEVWHRPVMGYEVHMYENGQEKEKRAMGEHTLQYAEDCAENWVERIIK